MATYLADTNLLLRIADAASSQHLIAAGAVKQLLGRDDQIFLAAQNFIEFWAVATRPVGANGLGWNNERTAREVAEMQKRFRFLKDSPEIFTHWLGLVQKYSVSGKRVHDARLVAVLEVYGIENLVTFNLADFTVFSSISLVDPYSLITRPAK